MKQIPPYYKQDHNYSCSLAVLRMVLASKDIDVTEKELIEKISVDYGSNFKNIWNPTIAKLAQQYGLQTTMYALWPLFKPELMKQALEEYIKSPETFNVNKYENPNDTDTSTEPLPLAYKEMFEAVKLGCIPVYQKLTEQLIKDHLDKGNLIQTSIKLHLLYPDKKQTYHSILIFDYNKDTLTYHDPAFGENLSCTIDHLLTAATDVGAGIIYT